MADQLDRFKEALSDRYRIERELGSGGMATVYLADDLKHHRKVAVKVVRPELAASLGAARFLREIEITAQLNHPNILTLIDSGAADGTLYYVMPYLEGESLRDRLNREKQLPVDAAVEITKEVADALGYAHSRGLIHRDIKPENIMFEAGHAVVTDFGIARAVTAAGGETLTETGLAIGTPAYMSPEQATGERDLDARSDVYSLGCVLYEMLAGEAPYSAPTPQALIAKKLSEPTPRISVVREVVPYGVEVALEQALAKTPVDRFTTAEEFIKALETPAVKAPVMKGRKLRIGVAAAAIILVIAAALLLPRSSGGAFDPNRILVVEFEDESGLEEAKALGSMAQDYIIDILTDAGFVEVVDPFTAEVVSQLVAAADTDGGARGIQALADEARAGTVVSGSIYAEGDSLQIQSRITDARNGKLLRTVGPTVGSIRERSELVVRLGQEVAAALAPLLNQDLESWEPTVQPATYEAYEAYTEAYQAVFRGREATEVGGYFERAAAADPTFYRAALWAVHWYQMAGRSVDTAYFARADSLIATLVESREQLSRYERCRLDFVMAIGQLLDHSAAYEAARCMVQASPGSDDAKRELALFAYRVNRPGEAIEVLVELDPDRGVMKHCNCYWPTLIGAYHMLGDYEGELEAVRQARQRFPEGLGWLALETRPLAALGRLEEVTARVAAMRSRHEGLRERLHYLMDLVAAHLWVHGHRAAAREVIDEMIDWYQSHPPETEISRAGLGFALYAARRWEDATRLFEELAEEDPEGTDHLPVLGRLAARRGDRAEALRISEELRSIEDPLTESRNTLKRAEIAALLKDREQAVTLLQEALDQGLDRGPGQGWGYGAWLHTHIDFFDSLHDYPPFQELMRPKG
jgi:tRNA A-37 threonylcarbamoyl transferase component Bud32/tetratricopeptide (TPR) repeat protein